MKSLRLAALTGWLAVVWVPAATLSGCAEDPTRDAAPPAAADARPAPANPDKLNSMPSASRPDGGGR
ncbi:MAG: hypothetical protein ACK47B_11220 [Armatimonadota bacterium]